MCREGTYNVRSLTERVLFEVFRLFMFTSHHINCDELIWDLFLLEHNSYHASESGERRAIELQDHPKIKIAVRM